MTSWPTSGVRERVRGDGAGRRRPRARPPRRRDRPVPATARASGVPRRGRGSSSEEGNADRRLGRQPGLEVGDAIGTTDLDPAGVEDRRGQRGREVGCRLEPAVLGRLAARAARRLPGSRPPRPRRSRGGAGARHCRRARRGRRPARAPAVRPAGDAGRRHVAALGHRSQAVGPLLGGLARHRRQALDERPELVLAEQPDDGVAVVVAEARRLEVELDRQVAHDRRQVAAHADLVDVLAQLVARASPGSPRRGARTASRGRRTRGSASPRSSRRRPGRPGCCRSGRP